MIMKYLLILFLSFFSISAFSQGIYNKAATNIKQNRLMADSVLGVPRDTSSTNNATFNGAPVGDSGRIAYYMGKFWGHDNMGWDILGSDVDLSNYNTRREDSIRFVSWLNTINDGNPSITTADTLLAFGDSYTLGVGATIPNRGYINLLANKLGVRLFNYAESGRGVFIASRKSFENAPDSMSNYMVTALIGFNDIWKGEGGFKSRTKVFWGIRNIITNNFLKTARPASSSTISYVGSWGVVPTDTLGGKSFHMGGSGRSSSSSADTAVFSFSGPNLVVGTFATDGIIKTSPFFQVFVDGNPKGVFSMEGTTDGISDGVYSNVYMPANVIIQDLGPGNHIAQIVPGNAMGTGGKTFILDYLGTLSVPDSVQPVIIGQLPKLSESGYQELKDSYNKIVNDNTMILADSIIKAAITRSFMGYPVSFAPLSNYVNAYHDNITDNVHYNDDGHQNIERAFSSVIKKIKTPIYGYSDPVNNLQTVTTNGNFTSNILALYGFNKTPTSGTALELSFNSTFDGGTGFIFPVTRPSGIYSPLRIRGSKIVFDNGNVGIGQSTNASVPTSKLYIDGSFGINVQTITNTTTIDATAHTINVNNSSNITINLPAASSCIGRIYVIKKISNNAFTVSVDPNASENIEGSSTPYSITTYLQSITIQCDGTAWWIY